jgi:HSP20 family protein
MLATIFDDLYNLQSELDDILFSDYRVRRSRFPRVNIYENDDEYVVSAELPGVEKNDVSITLKDNSLKISGEIKRENNDKKNAHLEERHTGKFERNFILNERVDAEKINAELKNGILLVKIPKSAETKPVSINIK